MGANPSAWAIFFCGGCSKRGHAKKQTSHPLRIFVPWGTHMEPDKGPVATEGRWSKPRPRNVRFHVGWEGNTESDEACRQGRSPPALGVRRERTRKGPWRLAIEPGMELNRHIQASSRLLRVLGFRVYDVRMYGVCKLSCEPGPASESTGFWVYQKCPQNEAVSNCQVLPSYFVCRIPFLPRISPPPQKKSRLVPIKGLLSLKWGLEGEKHVSQLDRLPLDFWGVRDSSVLFLGLLSCRFLFKFVILNWWFSKINLLVQSWLTNLYVGKGSNRPSVGLFLTLFRHL